MGTAVRGDGPRLGQGWPWVAVLAGAFLLKTALALTLAGHPLLQPDGELDSGEYWRLAQRVAGGDALMAGTPFYVSPLYIYWLAVAQTVTGASVAGVLVLQAMLGTVAVWVAGRTARDWAEAVVAGRAQLLAGGLLALTGIVALQEALILQSALDPLLTALVAFTFTRALQAPSLARWAWCGAALPRWPPTARMCGCWRQCVSSARLAGLGQPGPTKRQQTGPTRRQHPGAGRERGCTPWALGSSARRSCSRRSRCERRLPQASGRSCRAMAD